MSTRCRASQAVKARVDVLDTLSALGKLLWVLVVALCATAMAVWLVFQLAVWLVLTAVAA